MGVSCDPGCAEWAKSFGDCICNSRDLSSFVLGLLSVCCMGICCLPQIIINFVNGSSEGLSLSMILIWTVGDVCNLAGVFLTKAVSGWSEIRFQIMHNQLLCRSAFLPTELAFAVANTGVYGGALCGTRSSAELPTLLVLLLDHPQTQEARCSTACCSSNTIW